MSGSRFLACAAAFFAMAALSPAKPTVFIIGDSTVRNSTAGQMGWGDPLVARFDPAKTTVVNRAIGGRSSRTFLTEGRWDAVMAHFKTGDHLLIQFGHNDGGPLNDDRCRASLRGTGEETEDIIRKTDGKPETVRSFGWYLRNYIRGAKSKGVSPILVTPIPRNIWKDGRITRSRDGHVDWVKKVAEEEGVPCIDLHTILCDRYDAIGREETAKNFAGADHTHTAAAGAEFHADAVAAALRTLEGSDLGKLLLPDDLWLPAVFGDHMVLQRDVPLPVWGRAAAGAKVRVRFASHDREVVAESDGRWSCTLPAQPAGGPHELVVSSGKAVRAFRDVLLGEVWFCSGQSNMDFTLASTPKRSFSGVVDWQNEVAAADHPRIRMFTAEWTMREFPQRDVEGSWKVCTPANAPDFSAVAYYFARDLQETLGVPVGLVTSAFGASTIEAWIREEKLRSVPAFEPLLKAFANKRTAFRDDPKAFETHGLALAKWNGTGRAPKNPDPVQDQHNPYVLHNGMVAPIAPYAIRGALWYQGESNLGTRDIYQDLQKALIEDWRALWNQPELPFYFVQLAAYKAPPKDPAGGGQIAEMREAQAKSLAIPHTGMAVTIDIGDEKDIHPRNKRDVGKRLARLARVGTYRQPGVPCGPLFREASIEGGAIRISFDHTEGGLVSKSGEPRGFSIAGADKRFVNAVAHIEGATVKISSPEVPSPAFVRYAWADNPAAANLCNTEGLPAAPFRTDP